MNENAELMNFANATEERIVAELNLTPSDRHADMADIKNPNGDSIGFVRCYDGDKLYKYAYLSIGIGPGARYFNMHIMPDPAVDLPRFLFEGMCSTHGSQVSTDVLFDSDLQMNIAEIAAQYRDFEDIYKEAKAGEITFEPSRQVHMRALASPYFLCTFGLPVEKLAPMEAVANQYLSAWLKHYANAAQLDDAAAAERKKRRDHMAQMVIDLDPDRQMVVQALGEPVVQGIEAAVMF